MPQGLLNAAKVMSSSLGLELPNAAEARTLEGNSRFPQGLGALPYSLFGTTEAVP